MNQRTLSFPGRTAIQVKPTTKQLLAAQKAYRNQVEVIQSDPTTEFMYYVDEKTIVAFKNDESKFWEVVNAQAH